tara:strand:- start:487 stop:678 length:192 start_codon:yes stop_codon:yes gene_type:complete
VVGRMTLMSKNLISDQTSENEEEMLEIFYFSFGELRQALVKSDERWKHFLLSIDAREIYGKYF